MGVSTDAILFYGYVWEDDEDEDLASAIFDWDDENYRKHEFEIEITQHGYGDNPLPILAAKGSRTTAPRYVPKVIKSLDVKDEWDRELHRWFLSTGFEKPQGAPQWHLVSYWG